ncbi:MAG: phage shock protein operon transcriptional activator [Pseudohongiellaceae bacterium]
MQEDSSPPRMIGESSSFLEMQEHVSKVAPLHKSVLIVGERGTGKELVAARLHYLSSRWEQNFLKINCAAMNENLLEAQLFGYEAGAFTGAGKQTKGYFERADKGTLFLDELSNTARAVQEKILRVIEYGEFERLGGTHTVKVDVRLVAATNEDLPSLASDGRFREDLLDRLAFDVVTLPPLRERLEDILVLAEHFAMGMVQEMGWEFFAGFSESTVRQLQEYPWPGNIRELKNVIERAVYQSGNEEITSLIFNPFESPYRVRGSATGADRPDSRKSGDESGDEPAPGSGPSDCGNAVNSDRVNFKDEVQQFEINLLTKAMEQCQFNQKKAAEVLNLSYHQLRGYLRKYDLLK